MPMTDENIQELISERIHDADSEKNENMVHCLQAFFNGKMTIETLKDIMHKGYANDEWIKPPWEM